MKTGLFSFLCLLVLVTAAPSPIQKRSFTVERVPNSKFTGRNGPQALAKAYRKFGVPLPQGLVTALDTQKLARRQTFLDVGTFEGAVNPNRTSPGQEGTVAATPEENDAEYLAPVTIGGQKLNLDFDTGSSDLWVFNTHLAEAVTSGHATYDPKKSKTFALIPDAEFNVSYGDGSGASGIVGTDVVDLGGASFHAQAVELATEVSAQFVKDQNNDGLLGLAFSTLNTVKPQQQRTFFDNVKDSLAEPVFTANLRHNAVGSYEFGSVDTSLFKGPMAWIPVDASSGFWQFTSSSFAVNGKKGNAPPGGKAIADTGTTLLIADAAVVEGYYENVQGAQLDQEAGGVVFPCDAALPDLELDVGGYMARIKGEHIRFAENGDGTCFGGLQPNQQSGLGIYGDILFKSQFVAFNGGNMSLGLAPHA